MTVIKGIKSIGFKSFAKPTDLKFGNDYSAIIGPNGSGKSICYDSIVTLANGEEIKIGNLIEKQLKTNKIKTLKEGIYCESKEPVEIISINPITMKQEVKQVSKFIKREGEKVYKIKTRTGKEVKATGCHPVMVFRDNKLKSTLIRDLKESDLIASPRVINTISKKENLTNVFDSNLIKKEYVNEEFARFLGYIIGDGHIHKGGPRFTNNDKNLIEDFQKCSKNLFNLNPKKYKYDYKNSYEIVLHSKILTNNLKKLFNNKIKSNNKHIPKIIQSSNKIIISNLIAALYDTDGSIRKDISIIEYCSKNKILTQQLQRLLLRFNIISKVKKRINYASNTEDKIKRNYYYLYIYGYENLKQFYINIPLKCNYKREILESHINKDITPNPNNDLLPRETNIQIKKLTKLLGVKVKKERKRYPKLAAYVENRCNPTRQGVNETLKFFETKLKNLKQTASNLELNKNSLTNALPIFNIPYTKASEQIGLNKNYIADSLIHHNRNTSQENLQNLQSFIQTTLQDRLTEIKEIFNLLNTLANSDIYWDEITLIKQLKEEKYVYDLTIPENHNFIANGLFVHNSNVIDSLCFVLGRLSAKSLRADRASSLIYNGGKDGNPAKHAEVSIIFDNKNNDFPFKEDDIEIKRLVNQKGNSTYKINNEKRTRQQVVDLLKNAKINPDGHNIVLQGDITHMADMPAEERRKVLEDISGISMFEDKKVKALSELEKVDSRLSETEIIMTERETYLRELKKDRDQALKYKDLEKNINRNKATFYNTQIREKEEKIRELETRLLRNQKDIDRIKDNIDSYGEEIDNKKKVLMELTERIESKGAGEGLTKEIESLKESLLKSSARIESLQNEIKRINERKQQLNNNLQESGKKNSSLLTEQEDLQKKITQLSKDKEITISQLNTFKNKHNIGNIEKEISQLDSKIDSLKSSLTSSEEKSRLLLREKDQLTFKLKNIEESISKAGNKEQQDKLKELKLNFTNTASILNKELDENSSLSSQLGNARNSLYKSQETHASLAAKQVSITESSASSLAIRKIKESNFKGMHGLVSELGEAESKYSLALEIAAGSRINSIVVENDEIASKCIKYLKDNKLGVATFLPLNKLKSKYTVPLKLGHGLATSLVKYEPQYKNVFNYVFGNTIVVDHINAARKIGIGKVRMATLEGDLVESSGAMIGGYRNRKFGSFKEKGFQDKINSLEGEMSELRTLVQTLDKRKLENESKIDSLREEKANLEANIIKIEQTLPNIDLEALNKEQSLLQDELQRIDSELSLLDIENIKLELNKLLPIRTEFSKKIAAKQSPELMKQLKNLETSLDSLKEKEILYSTRIENISTQIKDMLDPEKENVLKILKGHEKEVELFLEEITTLTAQMSENKTLLKERQVKEKKLYSGFKQLFVKRNKLNSEIQKRELRINNEENKITLFEDRVNNYNNEKAKVFSELSGIKQEFEPYRDEQLRKGITFVQLKDEIYKFERLMKDMGNVNLRSLEIYNEVHKEYDQITTKVEKLKEEKNDVVSMIQEIESKKTGVFMKTFNEISKNFETTFSKLTTKGNTAHLALENPENPLDDGVRILVKISNNKYLDIKSLSGGEKTMTALAFIFAIQESDPASFYVFDEVDAALDKKNSEKLSELIKEYSDRAQYIVITHNDSVIHSASRLYGVSMRENGISNVVSLKI